MDDLAEFLFVTFTLALIRVSPLIWFLIVG